MLLTNEDMKGVFNSMLWHLKVRLTTRCNMSCAHCYAASEQYINEPLRLENTEWFERLVKSKYIRFSHLQGGEPTLEPELIKELTKISHFYNKPVCVFTNGKRLYEDEDFRNEFLSYGVDNIIVSFNKYLEAQTDQAKVVNTLMHFFEDKSIKFGSTAIIDKAHERHLQRWIEYSNWPPYYPEDFSDIEAKLENRKYWKFQLPLCESDRGKKTEANNDVAKIMWPMLGCDFSTVLMPSGFLQADCGCSSVKKCLLGHIDDFGDDPMEYLYNNRSHHLKNNVFANGFYELCLKNDNMKCLQNYPPHIHPEIEYELRKRF